MRKTVVGLALVLGVWGCERAKAPAQASAPVDRQMQLSQKDAPESASDDDAIDDERDGKDYELVVKLKPTADMDAELKALDDAEPEDFRWNSVEGAKDGLALGDLAGDEDVGEALTRIRQDPRVEFAEPLVEVHADFVPNDPEYKQQWNLKQIHMEDAWDETQGEGVTVAVIDTGIAFEDYGEFKQVPDLKGIKFAKGYNFVADNDHPDDDQGHGTHVAGTVAQATNNGEGVAGIAFKATLMPIKVLDENGTGNSADIADAIFWAADHGAQVINMSLGGGAPSKAMGDAVAYARKHGVVVVCAAGNARRGIVEYPAAYPGAVAVSAVGPSGELAPYSSWGKEIDIAAPGGDKSQGEQNGILQQTIDPSDPSHAVYAYYQGTSMATPHVAGVAALLYGAGAKDPDAVEKALFAGAEASAQGGWNDRKGHGLLNAHASLAALEGKTVAHEPEVAQADVSDDGAFSVLDEAADTTGALVKFGLALAMAFGIAISLRKRERSTLSPALLTALMLSAAGLWFLPKPATHGMASTALKLIEIPLPDWGKWLFGPGRASPLFYSALIPFGLSVVGYFWKASRPVMAGVCIGFASFLAYCAWSGAPAIAWMPLRMIAIPFLVVNVVLCLFFGRALLRKEVA